MTSKASPRPAGRPSKAARDPDRSRRELLSAAAKLFARDGFEATSVERICDRAGLSKGTFYWTFSSKDELLHELLEERVEEPLRQAAQLIATSGPERDMSVEASRTLAEFLRADRTAVVLDDEFWRRALRDRPTRERYSRRQRDLRRAFTEALEARAEHLGAPAFDTPTEHVAIAYLALLSGIARSRLVDPRGIPDGLYGEMVALIFQGLIYRAERSGSSAS
jgi:AcrR family transcriptional regulator